MHAVKFVGPGDTTRWVIVRRYGSWRVQHQPEAPAQEWATLTALARVGAPTPQPLWMDPVGALFGCPTLVTSMMPGRGDLLPRNPTRWLTELAQALATIHAAPLLPEELAILPDQQATLTRFLEEADAPPAELAAQPHGTAVWEAMRRLWPTVEHGPPRIVHGDFWPGNTLWHRGGLTAVIDWEQARRGNPAQDIGCCRQDLALLLGAGAAETFLHAYETASGRPVPQLVFWDLYMITWSLGQLDGWLRGYHDLGRTDLSLDVANARLEAWIADALARAEGLTAT